MRNRKRSAPEGSLRLSQVLFLGHKKEHWPRKGKRSKKCPFQRVVKKRALEG